MVVPGWKDVVHGSTCATASRPRVSACSSFSCFPDDPRKMRGFSIPSSESTWRRHILSGNRGEASSDHAAFRLLWRLHDIGFT